MAFPNLISTNGQPITAFAGPVLVGSTLNVFLFDGTRIENFSSSDGVTWFGTTSLGPVHDSAKPFTIVVKGGTIWVITSDPASGHQAFTPFDSGSSTFGSTTITTNSGATNNGPVSAALRTTDGKIVVAGQPTSLFYLSHVRTGYFVFDPVALTATPWTIMGYTTNDTAHACQCGGIMPGAAGQMNFLVWTYGTPFSSSNSLLQEQTLSAGGVLGTLTTIDSVAVTGSVLPLYPQCFSDGTNAAIVWQQKANALNVKTYTADVATWTWSAANTIALPGSETSLGSVSVMIEAAGAVDAFLFSLNATGASIWLSQNGTAPVLVGTAAGETSVPVFGLWSNPLGSTPFGLAFDLNSTDGFYFWSGAAAPPSPVVPVFVIVLPKRFVLLPDGEHRCCDSPPKCKPKGLVS